MEERKFVQLDALRCFAFISVLGVHWGWSGKEVADGLGIGPRALDLFFAISGFLITLILIRSRYKEADTKTSLYKFYARRFLRIFPIYYTFLLIVFLFNRGKIADSILWNLTYLSNFYSIKTQQFGGVGHLWSLAVEEQFYFVWPFIILLVSRKYLPYAIGACICLSLAAKTYWLAEGYPFWVSYMHPLGSLDVLSIGGLLAYFYYFYPERLWSVLYNPYITAVIFLQMALCFASQRYAQTDFIFQIGIRTCWGFFCLWLTGRAVFGFKGIAGSILSYKPLIYIGTISYSMYLFHTLIPGIFLGMKYPKEENLRFVIFFLVIIAIGTVSWYLIEKPILKLKKRFE